MQSTSSAPASKDYTTTHSHEATLEQASPMVRQFLEVKRQHPQALLFYRMGDFYETFFEDALTTARALEITLTGRDAGGLGRIPMAGVPVKAVDVYINRLLAMQFKVAICEQMQDPAEAKGLVERRVVRVLSSGTVTEATQIKATENNYLAALWLPVDKEGALLPKAHEANGCALAYVDVSTGLFEASQLAYGQMLGELDRLNPAELLLPGSHRKSLAGLGISEWLALAPEAITENYPCTPLPQSAFEPTNGTVQLQRLLSVSSLEGYGLSPSHPLLRPCGALATYINDTFLEEKPPLDGIRLRNPERHVALSPVTRKNLELLTTARDGQSEGSLFWVLNQTMTSMGARLLRDWVSAPLTDLQAITERQESVALLVEAASLRRAIRDLLPHIYDVQRLATRLAGTSALPRDLVALAQSLEQLPYLSQLLSDFLTRFPATARKPSLGFTLTQLPEAVALAHGTIRQALLDNPAVGIKEGGLFKEGYHAELDRLRYVMSHQEEWLQQYEQEQKQLSGLKTLKVLYSRAFGYCIEISKALAAQAPEHFTRKQTLTNAERFTTPELKQFESEVLEAQTRLTQLEYELFLQLRLTLKPLAASLKQVAEALAELDVLQSLAEVAAENDYCRPQLDSSLTLQLEQCRHPVVEKQRAMGSFVPNDCALAGFDGHLSDGLHNDPQILVLTGPNMAGKSTYMRQLALCCLMAQMGSFIPATAARLGLIDAVYTRIGAVDDLAAGQSTFMVEMAETAQILHGATPRSLVILDEVGRGTSTYDGLAIAWSVLDYLVRRVGSRTLFATHYHELNVLEAIYPGRIQNARVCVAEQGNTITFLHRVEAGSAQRSYGIQVARMAGLPAEVVQLADRKLAELQKQADKQLIDRRISLSGLDADAVQLQLLQ